MAEQPGRLTTHVLDTAAGKPAAGVRITVSRNGVTLCDIVTNHDGRAPGPLLAGADFTPGVYEIEFHVGDYFRKQGGAPAAPDVTPFLDVVPVRFGIRDASQHYHVPLLISPFGYSTYRGS